jgi:hypothetical protein
MTLVRPGLRTLLGAILACFALAAPGEAQFLVNTYTEFDQAQSSVCADAEGNFVIVWSSGWVCSNCEPYQDGDQSGIFGQRFSRTGVPLGSEFQVNQYTLDRQIGARVACTPDGNFMVTWVTILYRLSGRIFGPDGIPLSDEFPLAENDDPGSSYPAVDVDGDATGTFTAAWERGRAGLGTEIFVRRFAADGTPEAPQVQVSPSSTASQPALACTASGDCIVTWTGGAQESIYARRWASNGAPIGDPFQVNTDVPYLQHDPAVDIDATGAFVVVWNTVVLADFVRSGASMRRYDPTGAPLGPEIQIATEPGAGWDPPDWGPYGVAVAIGDGGDFLVAWSGTANGGFQSAQFAQRFSTAGTAVGAPFQLNHVTGSYQYYMRTARISSDQLLLTWTSSEAHTDERGSYDVLAGFCYLAAPVTCPEVPQDDCAAAGSARLRLRRNADRARNQLGLDLTAAEDVPVSAFGAPDLDACGASYALCVYEESESGARLVASSGVAPGGECAGRRCWKGNRKGFSYRNRGGTTTNMRLRAGRSGRAALGARAMGIDLNLPSSGAVTAQAMRSGGTCWTSTFTRSDVRLDNGVSFLATK